MYSYNKLIVLRLQVSVRNLVCTGVEYKMCAYRRSLDADRARITRVIKVSECPSSVQCSVFTVVLVLCRILARHVN